MPDPLVIGFGFGDKIVDSHGINKIYKLKDYLKKHGYDNIVTQVDGNVSFENAKKMRKA